MTANHLISVPVHRSRPLGDVETRRTAAEALALVEPLVRAHDPLARLVLVVSGSDIDAHGRSSRWEFFWDLPAWRARAVFVVGLLSEVEHRGPGADALLEALQPFPESGSRLAESGAIERAWQAEMARRGALTLPFRDSPAAVRDLASQGVDFVAGDTSLTLSGRTLPDGQTVWEAVAYGVTYRTPLASSGTQSEGVVNS